MDINFYPDLYVDDSNDELIRHLIANTEAYKAQIQEHQFITQFRKELQEFLQNNSDLDESTSQ